MDDERLARNVFKKFWSQTTTEPLESMSRMKPNSTPNALQNGTFLRIWLASLVSGTAVAAHDTAATWMMNLMSPSGFFISLMASLASLPFFLSELWVIAQRAMPGSARGRISALMMVLSQGA